MSLCVRLCSVISFLPNRDRHRHFFEEEVRYVYLYLLVSCQGNRFCFCAWSIVVGRALKECRGRLHGVLLVIQCHITSHTPAPVSIPGTNKGQFLCFAEARVNVVDSGGPRFYRSDIHVVATGKILCKVMRIM